MKNYVSDKLKGATKLLPKIIFEFAIKNRRQRNQYFELLFLEIDVHFGT